MLRFGEPVRNGEGVRREGLAGFTAREMEAKAGEGFRASPAGLASSPAAEAAATTAGSLLRRLAPCL